jgi:colicin import membrane protein
MIGSATSYSIAVVSSVVLHLIVVGALLISWQPKTEKKVVQPQYIKAELVELAAKQKAVVPSKTKPAVDRAAKKREMEKRRIAEQRKAEQKRAEQQRIAQLKAEREAKEKAEQERIAREQKQRQDELERQRRRAERAEKLRAQQALATAEADRESANSYLQVIQGRLSQHWSRPPSARRGMETIIELRLVPTGRIVGVMIVKSSGDLAFDRSVEQAAFKASPFTELQSMEPRVFEQYFRTVKVAFNPEDLRL